MAETTATEPEAPSTEVVVPTQMTSPAGSALERAAEAALTMPGIPGRDEFLSLAMQARILCMSGAAPEQVRDNPHLAFHIAMVGRDLGISPSAALEQIDVIATGKGPRLSLSPQLMNGQIARLGLGKILPGERSDDRAIAIAINADGERMGESEFTWADAQTAGLVGINCKPGEHKKDGQGRCPCNQGYRTYPKRMLWWRAAGFCADDFFPEASLGMYQPEALGAVVDVDGRPIDPATVDLPEGYQPDAPPPPELADPEAVFALQMRLAALPDAQRGSLRGTWKDKTLPPGHALDASQLRLANALVNGAEASARSTGWRQADEMAAVTRRLGTILAGVFALGGAGWHEPAPTPPGAPQPDPPAPSPPEAPGDAPEPPQPPPSRQVPEPPGGKRYEQVPLDADPAALDGATEEQVDDVIGRIKEMKAHDVDQELTRLHQHTEGPINDRRRRLAVALLREQLNTSPSDAPPEA